jgi:hypothetical protein
MHHSELGLRRMQRANPKNNTAAKPTTHEGYCAMGTMATSQQLAHTTHAKSPAMRRVCPSPEVLKNPV